MTSIVSSISQLNQTLGPLGSFIGLLGAIGVWKFVGFVVHEARAYRERRKEEEMYALLDALPISNRYGGGNAVRPSVGSKQHRMLRELARRGLLAELAGGIYMHKGMVNPGAFGKPY